MASSDGSNWIAQTTAANGRLLRVAYGEGVFVAVGENGLILASNPGGGWSQAMTPIATNLYSVTYGDRSFVAVGDSGTILRSTNGQVWVQEPSPTTNQLKLISFGSGLFAALGEPNSGFQMPLLTSTNGSTWTVESVSAPGRMLNDFQFGDGRFTLVGQNILSPGILTVTPNGHQWSLTNLDLSGFQNLNIMGVAFGQGAWVSVADGWIIEFREGGPLFTPPSSRTCAFRDVTFGMDRFVAVAAGGCLVLSLDGTNWVGAPQTFTENLNDIVYANDTFVTVGARGTIARSSNGVSWDRVSTPITNDLFGVAFGGGTFVAVGDAGSILSSTDTLNWLVVSCTRLRTEQGPS